MRRCSKNEGSTVIEKISNFYPRIYLPYIAIDNCPMRVVKHIIIRTIEVTNRGDTSSQMQLIRRIMEDIYGGTWGVLIIEGTNLVGKSVHWTIPDHKHRDGSAAFCLYDENEVQYNVFKTGDKDTEDRITLEQAMAKISDNIRG